MKNIVFIASPACGKGTQSELLVEKYGYCHISTGDLLREEVNNKTDLGRKIQGIISSGKLVNDEIVLKLVENKLVDIDNFFILDGFPRTLKQCELLTDVLNKINKKIDLVIYLKVDYDISLKRALGRQNCPNCKKNYNFLIEEMKPKVEDICDECNQKLVSRSDDNESSFKERYDTFITTIEPILNYYKNLGILCTVNCNKAASLVFEDIEEVI